MAPKLGAGDTQGSLMSFQNISGKIKLFNILKFCLLEMTSIRELLALIFTLTSFISPCEMMPHTVFTLHFIWKRCSNDRLARNSAFWAVLTLSLQGGRGPWSQWFLLTKTLVIEFVGSQEGSLCLMNSHTGFLWTPRSFSQEYVQISLSEKTDQWQTFCNGCFA